MELREQYNAALHTQLRKLKRCGTGFLVAGLVLVLACVFTPFTVSTIISNQAKKSAQLSAANSVNWGDVPGSLDIGIYWHMYLYNCTNPMEVTYRNAKPEFVEHGPYTYQGFDSHNDIAYKDLANELS